MTVARRIPSDPAGRFAITGLLAWAAATTLIRLAPAAAFRLPLPWAITALAAAVAGLVPLTRLILRGVARQDQARSIAAFVVPGMLGDCGTTALYGAIFPNLPASGQGAFGALMLAGYATMLAVGVAGAFPVERPAPAEG